MVKTAHGKQATRGAGHKTKTYVNELKNDSIVEDVFVVSHKEMRISRQGKPYLALQLSDRTGSIAAYHFAPEAADKEIPVGSAIKVSGSVGAYNDTMRINVRSMQPVRVRKPEVFMARSSRSGTEMFAQLHELIATIKTKTYRRLLQAVFGDKEFLRRFSLAPASLRSHHNFVGGLLEHTVAVASLCASLADQYPETDRDLLLTAAVLHDVGVADSVQFDTSITLTEQGQLLGHTLLGVQRIRDGVNKIGLSCEDALVTSLLHAIASHHGGQGEASMQRPATLEAVFLADADATDIRAASFIYAARDAVRVGEEWTDSANAFGRPLRAISGRKEHYSAKSA